MYHFVIIVLMSELYTKTIEKKVNTPFTTKDKVVPIVLAVSAFGVVLIGFAAAILGLAFDDAAFKTNAVKNVFLMISTISTLFFIVAGVWIALILTILSLVNLAIQKRVIIKIIFVSFVALSCIAILSWVCGIIGVIL